MSNIELEERELRVLEFIRRNPAKSKQQIVRAMSGNPSRITVLNILDRLEGQEFIICRKPKPNSQIYKIYINEDNLLMSVIHSLDNFEKVYFELINKVKKKIKEEVEHDEMKKPNLQHSIDFLKKEYSVVNSILLLFRHLVGMYILAGFFIWSKKGDKELLKQLYESVFSRLQRIQLRLIELFPGDASKQLDSQVIGMFFELNLEKLDEILKNCFSFGLGEKVLPVIDSLWEITEKSIPSSSFWPPSETLKGLIKDRRLKHLTEILS